MNKKIIPLFFAAAVGLNSCTEVLEPKVDYGDKTYINDYSALVSAINDMSKSFGERIEALNTLLKNGMAELKLAIDSNTGAITVLSQTTQQGLGEINSTLLEGFSTLSAQIDAQGKQIVYALNSNGEIIRLQLETNGKLISAQILATGNDLVKAINAQTNSLEERFSALTAAVSAGLKEVKVSIDANTGAITLLDKNTQASLDKIDGSITNGFRLVSETITDGNEKIVLAMNENGQMLRLQIDETGKLISAEIKAAAERLEAVLNDLTATLDARFKALTDMIEAGYKAIVVSIDKNTGAITMFDKNTQESLNTINTTMLNGFKQVSTQIDATGKQIVTAMDENGRLLRLELDETGKLISATISETGEEIVKAINDQTKTLEERFEALTTAVQTGLYNVQVSIDKNTKAIKLFDKNTQQSLDELNNTLVNGFTLLSTQIDKTGKRIVYAINNQTEVLRLEIDETGKLLAAEIDKAATRLVKVIRDQTKTLDERFKALTEAIEYGLYDVKVSIDKNTKAIKVFDKNTQESLDDINNTLFKGFKQVSKQIDETGNQIIDAMDDNGRKLRIVINKNGKLISATIEQAAEDIIKAINDQTKSLEERFKALTTAVKNGLYNISVKIDENTGAITLFDQNTQASLDEINKTLVKGFKRLNKQISATGGDIIYAMNENNKVLCLQIDTTGKLIDASIDEQGTAIMKAINDQTTTIKNRFKALTQAIDTGLLNVKLAIDKTTGAIDLLDKHTQASLTNVINGLNNGFMVLGQCVNNSAVAIVTAINNQGQVLKVAIDNNGNVISTAIDDAASDIVAAIGDQTSTLKKRFKALTEAIEGGISDVNLQLEGIAKKIKFQTKTLSGKLDDMMEELAKGFKLLKKEMRLDAIGIVSAINDNGELLAVNIKQNGDKIEVLSTEITGKLSDLTTKISTMNSTLTDKLTALNDLVETGVITELKTTNGKLEANTEAIKAINTTLAGDVLTALQNINQELTNISNDTDALKEILAYLKDSSTGMGELADVLKAQLADNGIYFNASKDKIMAVSPGIYLLCKSDADLLQYIKDFAPGYGAPQSIKMKSGSLDASKFKNSRVGFGDMAFTMIPGTYDSKPVYMPQHIRAWADYKIEPVDASVTTKFRSVAVDDAKGGNRYEYSGGTQVQTATVRVYMYDEKTDNYPGTDNLYIKPSLW